MGIRKILPHFLQWLWSGIEHEYEQNENWKKNASTGNSEVYPESLQQSEGLDISRAVLAVHSDLEVEMNDIESFGFIIEYPELKLPPDFLYKESNTHLRIGHSFGNIWQVCRGHAWIGSVEGKNFGSARRNLKKQYPGFRVFLLSKERRLNKI